MNKTVKFLKTAGNVLLWVFVALAVAMTLLIFAAQRNDSGLPTVFGKSFVTIQSGSMSPTIKKGDYIIVNGITSAEAAELKVGDIITFLTDLDGDGIKNEINTHRIDAVDYNGGLVTYTTKGDNTVTNPIADTSPVLYTNVLGVYSGTRIPGIGGFISFLQKPTGFALVIVLPLVLFFLYELYRFITVIVAIKQKDSVSVEKEEEIKKKAIEEYIRQQTVSKAASAGKTEENASSADKTPENKN